MKEVDSFQDCPFVSELDLLESYEQNLL